MIISLLFNATNALADNDNWYVAHKEDLKSFFESVGSRTGKAVIVSKQASKKQIDGKFNLNSPMDLIDMLSKEMGLIYYTDNNVIYIYDNSEMKSSLIFLQNSTLSELNSFLSSTGLYDERYKIKGGNQGAYYVSGPPAYVELVINAAKMIDANTDSIAIGREKVEIIHLVNTFVTDRTYELRNEKVTIPGISTIISQLLGSGNVSNVNEINVTDSRNTQGAVSMPQMPAFPKINDGRIERKKVDTDIPTIFKTDDNVTISAYPGNNTILVKGTHTQVEFVKKLVKSLDVAKRHIELSLWIIDINKNDLDNLGVDWSGGINVGGRISIGLNQGNSISTIDGNRFIANVYALEQKQKATVISRPVILTQENVPAIFDNNRSFYTKLIGERNSSLESVTYGTMISVLPRFGNLNQIELLLNIEDGNEDDTGQTTSSDALPKVGRTVISTIARVPQGKSLLIGGYTKDTHSIQRRKIPLIGSIPVIGNLFSYEGKNDNNVIRIFMIQPREVTEMEMPDSNSLQKDLNGLRNEFKNKNGNTDELINKWVNRYLNRDRGN